MTLLNDFFVQIQAFQLVQHGNAAWQVYLDSQEYYSSMTYNKEKEKDDTEQYFIELC